ncbi:MAG: hypothetical protein QUS13_13085 [Smithella sp.]|nr:hypothetical protein [Smithella sp.]
MKHTLLALVILTLVSCAVTRPKNNSSPVTGWNNEDTYTVTVTDKNLDSAVEAAKHRILKDIVDVRVRNNSRYTDIIMIKEEFRIPLNEGIIISQQNVPEGIQIFFQIRDKGLKHKFERK